MSAPQEIRFNINHQVKVRLTELGRSIYEDYLDKFYRELEPALGDRGATTFVNSTRTNPDADGYYTFQMDVLMHIFGGEEYMPITAGARPIPFETGIILLPSP